MEARGRLGTEVLSFLKQHAPAEESLRSVVLAPALREVSIVTQTGLARLLLSAEPRPVRGSSFAGGGSVELRAWFCACVRAHDALRCAPNRRVLTLSRIYGFHLYDILPSQPFLFVRVFGKTTNKGCSRASRNRIKKKGYFAVLTRTCRFACFSHPPGAVLRAAGISSFESA